MNSLYHAWGFSCGFPHSEISGSLAMCAYPKLIAAYHVLHRLLMPRHSPCALCSLTCIIFQNLWFCWKLILLNFSSWSFNSQRIYSWLCCILYTFIYVQFSKNKNIKLNSFINGGDKEIRTLDPLRARQVLSQLSYTPIYLAATYSPMPSPA